jgi:hypothetical protein
MDLVVQSPDELLAAVPHVLGFKLFWTTRSPEDFLRFGSRYGQTQLGTRNRQQHGGKLPNFQPKGTSRMYVASHT